MLNNHRLQAFDPKYWIINKYNDYLINTMLFLPHLQGLKKLIKFKCFGLGGYLAKVHPVKKNTGVLLSVWCIFSFCCLEKL